MKKAAIGIIGGTRGMGKWFADLLTGQGFTVHCSGRTSGMDKREMAEQCDVVVVSVPIGVTGEVIKEVGPLMRKQALLMDLTSLKAEPVRLMAEYSASEVIGCHPLFGPQVENMTGQHVVICPVRAGEWRPWLLKIFQAAGVVIVETTPKKHDEMMTIVQALNHLNTIAMGLVISALGIKTVDLDPFTTPVFRTKMDIVRRVFSSNPGLYSEIIANNPQSEQIIKEYKKTLSKLERIIRKKDAQALTNLMEENAPQICLKENP